VLGKRGLSRARSAVQDDDIDGHSTRLVVDVCELEVSRRAFEVRRDWLAVPSPTDRSWSRGDGAVLALLRLLLGHRVPICCRRTPPARGQARSKPSAEDNSGEPLSA
jgi:hypothetical protein